MSRVMSDKIPTIEDFGIDPTRPDWCPRCRSGGPELFETKVERPGMAPINQVTRWHCKDCGWTDSLTRHAGHALISTATEIAPAILRWHETGPPKGESLGFGATMDQHYRARRGEFSVVTGYPGHGKSQWMDAVMVNLAHKSNWKFAVFSPENVPYEQHVRGLMQKFAGNRFELMTREEVLLARKWLDQHFFFIDGDDITFEGLLAQFWKLVKDKDIQGVLIDPWNELESDIPHGMFKGDYIASCLKRFRSFCKAAHVHGWIIAHPSKGASQALKRTMDDEGKRPVVRLVDISDTAHFEIKCFVGVSIWRDPADPDRFTDTKVYILKHRTEGVGKVGSVVLSWNETSTAYSSVDQGLMNGQFPMDHLKRQLDKSSAGDWTKVARREEADWFLQERPLPWKRVHPIGEQKERFEVSDGVSEAMVWSEIQHRGTHEGAPSVRIWSARVTPRTGIAKLYEDCGTSSRAFDWAERELIQLPAEVAIENLGGATDGEEAPVSEPEADFDPDDRQ